MDNIKRIKKLPYIIAVLIIIGIAFFALRGPHISNILKKMILPELEMASGQNIIAKNIYINLYPLFIEAKGLKSFNEKGERILYAKRVKAYIGLSGLFKKNILLRRLVIGEPEITSNRKEIEQIIENIKAYSAKEPESSFTVSVMAVEVKKGKTSLYDEDSKLSSEIADLHGEIILGESPRIRISAGGMQIKREGLPDISGDVDANLTLKKDNLVINRFVLKSLGSELSGKGEYSSGKADFKAELQLLLMSAKKMFGLDSSGEGRINATGAVKYHDKTVSVDLSLQGGFFLETLMELLKVEERLEGFVEVKGQLQGPLHDLKGNAVASLRNGNLFNVSIDRLNCNISYEKGKMSFTGGEGRLYNGSAKASAAINLPVVDYFNLDIALTDVDSAPVFQLIGWDPVIENGKVTGSVASSGAHFNPHGWFTYTNRKKGTDILGRVNDISGRYSMQGSLLALSDLKLATGLSYLTINGNVDTNKQTLDLNGTMQTSDITDLTSPYYANLKGSAEYAGKIEGLFDNPVLKGKLKILDPVVEDYAAASVDAEFIYRKDNLTIRELTLKRKDELHKLTGDVYFKQAKALFDISLPEYRLHASLKNADLERFVKVFYKDFEGKGRLTAQIRVNGTDKNPRISADAGIEQAELYKVPVEAASFTFGFSDKKMTFSDMKIKKGVTLINADASLDTEGNFVYRASSDKIVLSDIVQRPLKGDVVFSAQSKGEGTFDNPLITVDAKITSGILKGKNIGGGAMTASVRNRDIALKASMMNDKIKVVGKGRLEKELRWEATIDIQSGRYDSLIATVLKDVPEDLILSLNGTAALKGDKNHIQGTAVVRHLVLSMYGYSFTNENEIRLSLKDRALDLNSISMRSGNTALSINGDLVMGDQYNLTLEGSTALSPFKSLSNKIGLLKGDADFVLSISGNWDSPRLNGGLTLTNGSFGLKDYYYRMSSVSGYMYIDNDRVILEKLTGKIGGGDVDISGILYLKKFAIRRFYIESMLKDINASISDDFDVNFGGSLLYKGTHDSQTISGDMIINRARYRERVEWKSWLLKAKKTETHKAEISRFEKANLNISITGKNNISIDNNVARATVNADMVLRGTIYRPILFGRLETKEGKVFFRNNEFRIIQASADFSDPHRINPFMEIASETIIKGYKIKMNLEGQAESFNLSLASDPPLKEMDILALLTVGQTGGELKGLEGGIGAGEATSFVTGKLQDVIEERLTSITGLDRLQIDPYVSKTTGAVEPRVTVSKRLLGDKMFVTYTASVGSAEEQIIKLEYFLNKRVSFVGVRDERGILGGDVRFRFEFK